MKWINILDKLPLENDRVLCFDGEIIEICNYKKFIISDRKLPGWGHINFVLAFYDEQDETGICFPTH